MTSLATAFVSMKPDFTGFRSTVVGESAVAGKLAGGSIGGAMKTALKGVGAGLLVGAGITKGLYEIGQSFEEVKKTIIVGTGASGKALEGLEASARKIGKSTPSSFGDIGTAVADLNTRLGLTGKPLEAMSTKVLNLSRITGTDLSTNIADVSRVFGDWGVNLKDQPAALDKIFTASQATGVGINDLSKSVVQMGAPLRQFGFSFEESLALFGKFEKEGVNTTAVMSGLKIGLGTFSKAGKDPERALAAVTAAIKGAGTAGKANEIAIKAFGQRAGPDMAAAVREGRFEIGDLVKTIQNSAGSIEDADKRTRTFSETWQLFKNNVLVTLQPLAEKVFATFTDFAANALPKIISAVSGFAAEMQAGVGAGGRFADALRFAGGVLSTLGSALQAVGGFVLEHSRAFTVLAGVVLAGAVAWKTYQAAQAVSLFWLKLHTVGTIQNTVATIAGTAAGLAAAAAAKVFAAGQWLVNAALTANPIGIVIALLVALGVGLYAAWRKSDTFREIVTGAFDAVRSKVTAVWENGVKPALSALGNFFTDTIPNAARGFRDAVANVFDSVRDKIGGVWENGIKPPLVSIKEFFTQTLPDAARGFRDLMGEIWDKIKDQARLAALNIGLKALEIAAALIEPFTLLPGRLGEPFKAALAKVEGFATSVKSEIAAIEDEEVGISFKIIRKEGTGFGPDSGGIGGGGRIPARIAAAARSGGAMGGVGILPKITGDMAGVRNVANAAAQTRSEIATQGAEAIQDKLKAAREKATQSNLGKAGPGGRVLPSGSYSIGMPYHGYPGHNGADYPAATGTPVYAPWPGRVTASYDIPGSNQYNTTPFASYGKLVKIAYNNGMTSLFAHLSSRIGATGPIAAGTMVGRVGMNGNATGPHLHAEFNGGSINPASTGLFDWGGIARGRGFMAKNIIAPERTLDPRTTQNFEKLTVALDRMDSRSTQARSSGPFIQHAVIRETVDLERYERQRAFRERMSNVGG